MATFSEDLFSMPMALPQQNNSKSISLEYHSIEDSYAFERIDFRYWLDTMVENWKLAFYVAGIYALTIFGLQTYMRNRPAFDLRTPLILWNAGLGIFSLVGFMRTASCMSKYMTGFNGLYKSICVKEYPEPQMMFWGLAFTISKYVELGDTLFIVLRKRPLQVLQWYHHMATLIVVWITGPLVEPVSRWFVTLNYGIHSAMYPYFALKMAGIDVPKVISNTITTAQFVQMLIGLMLNIFSIGSIALGSSCHRAPISIVAFLTVYGSFVVLFGKLFRNAVLNAGKSRKQIIAKKEL